MIALLAALALAQDPDEARTDGLAVEGHRIQAVSGGTGLGIGDKLVVGKDGGVNVLTVTVRVRAGDVQFGGSLPFAAYRVPEDGRDGDLGNVALWAHYRLPTEWEQHVGLRLHFAVAEHSAWTWANSAEELWPGAGVDAYWEARTGRDPLRWMLRGALGVHATRGQEPFPDTHAKFQAAGGLDATVVGPFGAVAEMTVQYWDTSPWEFAGLLRVDPTAGLRLRAGFVLPIAVWAGLSPTDQPAGAREATLLFDVTLAP